MSFSSSRNTPQDLTVGIAGAGGTQALATDLTTEYNVISTLTVTANDGVRLPKAVTGRRVTVYNNHATVVAEIFPGYDAASATASGDTIEGGSANAQATKKLLALDGRTYMAISGSEATAATPAVAGDWVVIHDSGVIA
jgi:hypothetical protein